MPTGSALIIYIKYPLIHHNTSLAIMHFIAFTVHYFMSLCFAHSSFDSYNIVKNRNLITNGVQIHQRIPLQLNASLVLCYRYTAYILRPLPKAPLYICTLLQTSFLLPVSEALSNKHHIQIPLPAPPTPCTLVQDDIYPFQTTY